MMAKKVAGRGQKTCPKCGTVVGARSAECECGHKFAVKTGTSSKRDGFAAVRAVTEFINQSGGIEKAKTQLESLSALLAATGGSREALAAIEQVEAIKKLK